MDAVEYKFELHDGTPPDGEPGYFFGFDEDNQPYILKWQAENDPCWLAVSLDEMPGMSAGPVAHALVENNIGKIKQWSSAPLRWSVLTADWPAVTPNPSKAPAVREDD